MNASLTLKLMINELIKPTVTANSAGKNVNPNWDIIDGGINFRGTLDDLTNNLLEVNLKNEKLFQLNVPGITVDNYNIFQKLVIYSLLLKLSINNFFIFE